MTASAQSEVTQLGMALAKTLARLADFTAELSENFHRDLGLEVPARVAPTAPLLGAKRKRAMVDPKAPKKPKTAYMLFNEWAREQAKIKGESAPLMTKLGEEWQAMSETDKARFVEEAEKLKDVYLKELEKYKAEGNSMLHDIIDDDIGSGNDVPPPNSH
ncbi:hypothetical protein C9890_0291 [Perkinsus sp. BL_2016]|nr:hypothetical protein C9890_0291 [Perkinsus sp. BL_2016]